MYTVNPKRVVLFITLLLTQLWSLSAFAIDPPDSVEKMFREKFPEAKGSKWIITEEPSKEYVVEFTNGKEQMKASFDKKANLVETEKKMNSKLLPESIKRILKYQFLHYKVLKCSEIRTQNNTIEYKMAIKTSGDKMTILMSSEGSWVPVKE